MTVLAVLRCSNIEDLTVMTVLAVMLWENRGLDGDNGTGGSALFKYRRFDGDDGTNGSTMPEKCGIIGDIGSKVIFQLPR